MMYEGSINVPLLRKELEFITAHQDQWDQSSWLGWIRPTGRSAELILESEQSACGTAGCLAGNTILHAGKVRYKHINGYIVMCAPNDTTWQAEAQSLLGLSELQADELFQSGNSLLDLWTLANKFTEGEIQIPEDVR